MTIVERTVPRDATLFTLLSAAQRLRDQMEQALIEGNGRFEIVRASFDAAFTASERNELARLLAKM